MRGQSPRDSGFEGASSSLKFESRPSSSAAVIPKIDTDDVSIVCGTELLGWLVDGTSAELHLP